MSEGNGTVITQEWLRRYLRYDENAGLFYWKIARAGRKAGARAGFIASDGRPRLRFSRRNYYASRVAWLYYYGKWPNNQIDHINGNVGDNRIANLREATQSQNNCNQGARKRNRHGLKGVSSVRNRWRAEICVSGSRKHLGVFDSPEAAHDAYRKAAMALHGEFACAGRR